MVRIRPGEPLLPPLPVPRRGTATRTQGPRQPLQAPWQCLSFRPSARARRVAADSAELVDAHVRSQRRLHPIGGRLERGRRERCCGVRGHVGFVLARKLSYVGENPDVGKGREVRTRRSGSALGEVSVLVTSSRIEAASADKANGLVLNSSLASSARMRAGESPGAAVERRQILLPIMVKRLDEDALLPCITSPATALHLVGDFASRGAADAVDHHSDRPLPPAASSTAS